MGSRRFWGQRSGGTKEDAPTTPEKEDGQQIKEFTPDETETGNMKETEKPVMARRPTIIATKKEANKYKHFGRAREIFRGNWGVNREGKKTMEFVLSLLFTFLALAIFWLATQSSEHNRNVGPFSAAQHDLEWNCDSNGHDCKKIDEVRSMPDAADYSMNYILQFFDAKWEDYWGDIVKSDDTTYATLASYRNFLFFSVNRILAIRLLKSDASVVGDCAPNQGFREIFPSCPHFSDEHRRGIWDWKVTDTKYWSFLDSTWNLVDMTKEVNSTFIDNSFVNVTTTYLETRVIAYNAGTQSIVKTSVVFRYKDMSGLVIPSFSNQAYRFGGYIYWIDWIRLCLEIFFWMVQIYFSFTEIFEYIGNYLQARNMGRSRIRSLFYHFHFFFNWIDLLQGVTATFYFVSWINLIANETFDKWSTASVEDVQEIFQTQASFDHHWKAFNPWDDLIDGSFPELFTGSSSEYYIAMVLNLLFILIKQFQYLEVSDGMGTFTRTLRAASSKISDFFFVLFLLIMAYSFFGFCFFGAFGHPGFIDLGTSIITLSLMTIGEFNYEELKAPISASFEWIMVIYFFSFILILFIIAPNILITIMIEGYENSKRAETDPFYVKAMKTMQAAVPKKLLGRRGLDGAHVIIAFASYHENTSRARVRDMLTTMDFIQESLGSNIVLIFSENEAVAEWKVLHDMLGVQDKLDGFAETPEKEQRASSVGLDHNWNMGVAKLMRAGSSKASQKSLAAEIKKGASEPELAHKGKSANRLEDTAAYKTSRLLTEAWAGSGPGDIYADLTGPYFKFRRPHVENEPEFTVLIEPWSTTVAESARFTKFLLKRAREVVPHVSSITVITSEYNRDRVEELYTRLFDRSKVLVQGVCTPDPEGEGIVETLQRREMYRAKAINSDVLASDRFDPQLVNGLWREYSKKKKHKNKQRNESERSSAGGPENADIEVAAPFRPVYTSG